jgi:uncharacterized protein YjiS (DUF1127 family)
MAMTTTLQQPSACRHPEIACRDGILGLFYKLVELPLIWQERRKERRHLAELPDYLLSDIGLSRPQVAYETGKWFWSR